jgi:hypothetical protein
VTHRISDFMGWKGRQTLWRRWIGRLLLLLDPLFQ